MNGQNSPVTSFLRKDDPSLLLPRIIQIVTSYNRDSWRIFDYFRRLWIVKVKYPLFKRLVRKIAESTADLLYEHPDLLVFVVTRYFVYLVQYCRWIGITPNECLDGIFPPGSVYMSMKTEPLEDGSLRILEYSLIVRTLIPNPEDLADRNGDKYTITRFEVNLVNRSYQVAQTCYGTNDPSKASMAEVLFEKQFELQRDGSLYNPNYAFSKDLQEEDLNYFRLMVSQLMVFLGGILEATTTILFISSKE